MNSACSGARLELALAGNLPDEEESFLHRHLEVCEACCAAMERMAADQAWRDEAVALLAADDLEQVQPLREEWSAMDFVVEHLEPTDKPGLLGCLGGYDVQEFIGHGGMGVVLKGFDRELHRCVAIKVLAPHLAHSSLARQRFAREARAAAAVVHPHVLAIHHVQPNGRLPFFVMPLVAGESLAQRLARQGTMEIKEVLRIGMQAAAGLAAAHEQGLIHRDVKPANILLEMGVDRAVLTDFGLARAADDAALTRWGIIAGTPQYMSPEQARGEPLDSRSDLFSLGCVLYEMATGVSPFSAGSTMATLRRLVDDAPQSMVSFNSELPPWFIPVVDRLLEKDPARRFSSAQEVSELLEGCLAHVQQPASVPLPATLPKSLRQPNSGRRFLIIGVIAMFAIVGASLLGWALFGVSEPPQLTSQEPKRAEAPQTLQASVRENNIPKAPFVRRFSASGNYVNKPGGVGPTITSLAISPNGRWLPFYFLRTEENNYLRLMDLQTGQPVVSIKLPDGMSFSHETFSPDSASLAARSGDGAIWLWDTATGAVKWTSTATIARANPMAFSADGKILYGAGKDRKSVKRWRTDNGQLLAGPWADEFGVNTVAINPDGTLLAILCTDNLIRILDANTGAVVTNFESGRYEISFSGDGKTLAGIAHSRTQKHRLWDVATWKELPGPPNAGDETFGTPNGFAIHPTRRLVAITTSDGLLRLWEIVEGKERLQTFQTVSDDQPGKVVSRPLAFTPDGQFLAVSHYSGAVSLLRVSDVAPEAILAP